MAMPELRGKTIVVTWASKGIGHSVTSTNELRDHDSPLPNMLPPTAQFGEDIGELAGRYDGVDPEPRFGIQSGKMPLTVLIELVVDTSERSIFLPRQSTFECLVANYFTFWPFDLSCHTGTEQRRFRQLASSKRAMWSRWRAARTEPEVAV
jgi:hypothetical protein